MVYGVILKHLEVDKITWSLRGADGLFGGKEGWGALILTGVEDTAEILMGDVTRPIRCRCYQMVKYSLLVQWNEPQMTPLLEGHLSIKNTKLQSQTGHFHSI
jgi:hypothetical protein